MVQTYDHNFTLSVLQIKQVKTLFKKIVVEYV